MSDDELYRRYLDGDRSAGDQLMIRYADSLTAYLAGFVHSEQDAEDLMLDCFTVILVNKPAIGEGRFRAYLFRMARNKACRMWRTRFGRQEFEIGEDIPSSGDSPEETAYKSERTAILHKCLGRIAPQYREALWLFYFMGLSYEQAASVMGCTKKRIDNLLMNGKKSLRRELEKEGVTDADV